MEEKPSTLAPTPIWTETTPKPDPSTLNESSDRSNTSSYWMEVSVCQQSDDQVDRWARQGRERFDPELSATLFQLSSLSLVAPLHLFQTWTSPQQQTTRTSLTSRTTSTFFRRRTRIFLRLSPTHMVTTSKPSPRTTLSASAT